MREIKRDYGIANWKWFDMTKLPIVRLGHLVSNVEGGNQKP